MLFWLIFAIPTTLTPLILPHITASLIATIPLASAMYAGYKDISYWRNHFSRETSDDHMPYVPLLQLQRGAPQ